MKGPIAGVLDSVDIHHRSGGNFQVGWTTTKPDAVEVIRLSDDGGLKLLKKESVVVLTWKGVSVREVGFISSNALHWRYKGLQPDGKHYFYAISEEEAFH